MLAYGWSNENQGDKQSKSFRLTLEIAGPFPLQPALETPGSIENRVHALGPAEVSACEEMEVNSSCLYFKSC